jgi:hypothetical protein
MLKCVYRGYEIVWDDLERKFNIFKHGVLVKEKLKSIEDSQKWIDSQNKKKFKRIPILHNFGYVGGEREKGEATSLVDDHVWISSGKNRCKTRPEYVWLDTPGNQEALKAIKEKYSQIAQLREEIFWIESNTKRLTKEMMLDE